ncbi:MAG: indole-3-glycerol phosphate synthase TrpC [Ruminococcus sp.]|jgi:indole-3-glycerol phosphate synthase|nr:indole-3-glycerol phosphate synthase TrpC [Ruminococcus sp.]
MNDILKEIADHARERVKLDMEKIPLLDMKGAAMELKLDEVPSGMPDYACGEFSFYQALSKPRLALICEIKKASPSKGVIAEDFDYLMIAEEYESAGADAISVLTEPKYFLGDDSYLKEISQAVDLPCLRKDFVVSEYQIYQAKVLGASAILLIVSLLDESTLSHYIHLAKSLRMDALVECHDAREIYIALSAGAKIVGVNNRDLKTFEVDTKRAARYRSLVPENILYVSESGIWNAQDITKALQINADAVLIGEALMRSNNKTRLMNDWTSWLDLIYRL